MSDFWKNEDGCVHRLTPDGKVGRAPPKNFGVLGNGHLIKLGSSPEQPTPWDQDYEAEFQKPDDQFPDVIRWLESLERKARHDHPASQRFGIAPVSDEIAAALFEGLVSLAVRSPRTREYSVGLAERFRGPLPPHERRAILGLNHRYVYRNLVKSPPRHGKFLIIYSPDREFVFGDGFFHNISGQNTPLGGLKILAPLTPWIAALFANPTSYRVDPRLTTLVISADEARALNDAVQVYSKDQIFYRSEAPDIIDAFRHAQHYIWDNPRNPIDMLIDGIPGVHPRDLSLHDHFEAMRRAGLYPPE